MPAHSSRYDYLFAVTTVLAALAISWILFERYPIYHQHGMFTWYLLAVAYVAWRRGFWPAVLATGLSAVIVAWCFMPPVHSFQVFSAEDVFRLLNFVTLATLINCLQNARVRAEQSLRASEQRLGFSLDSAEAGAWDADIAHGSFWHSVNLPAIYGVPTANFARTHEGFFAYIHPEDRNFFQLAMVGYGEKERTFEISHRIVNDDGQVRRVTTRGRMHLNAAGNVDRMVATVFVVDRAWQPKPASDAPTSTVAAIDQPVGVTEPTLTPG
jgi:PAS domain-containing protein